MIKNYFKTAWRSLKRNRFFSILNVTGLAIGMAVFLLMAQYVHFENSYENFIPNRDNVYRVSLSAYRNNQPILASAQTYPAVGPGLKNEIPGVNAYARLFNIGYRNNVVITNENAKPEPIAVKQRNFFIADPSFLPMMGYKMIKGDAGTVLAEPNTAVISGKYAQLYFGEEDPVGKVLRLRDDDLNDELVTVTGIFKDLPSNTHLKFDILVSSVSLFAGYHKPNWNRSNIYTYIELLPGTDLKAVESKLPSFISRNKPELNGSSEKQALSLQPVRDIHLHSNLSEEPEANGDAKIVFFVSLIGIFVIIIAWINYVNLYTARAVNRAKEVGVRKVLGSSRYQLILQFLAEATIMNSIAILTAFGIMMISLPLFNTLSGLELNSSHLIQPWFIGLLFILWLSGSLLSGLYPAFVISSFNPIGALKGRSKGSSFGIMLRKGLVVTQFAASVILIAGTLIVYLQLNFMLNRDIGMDIDQVMIIEQPAFIPGANNERTFDAAMNFFHNELKKDPSIASVTSSLTIPGKQREYKDIITNAGSPDSITVRVNVVDYDFTEVFRMKFIAGRNFSKDVSGGRDTSVVITESAARLLGYDDAKDAVGKPIAIKGYNHYRIIVGVVNDYHQLSLKTSLEPVVFYGSPKGGGYYALRIHTDRLTPAIQHIQQSWIKAFDGNPFEYFFLDDYFDRQYANEQKFGRLFTTLAVLAVMISCLGLFGLSAYAAAQRVKEIGIRKVLGASATGIVMLLSREFITLILVAFLIASPVCWYAMSRWLEGFAYRIEIEWWMFAAAGLTTVVVALLTVSWQAIRAAVANPVISLRTE